MLIILISLLPVIILNFLIQKPTSNDESLLNAIGVALPIAIIFQVLGYYSTGYLDPFFLIAFVVQIGIYTFIGLVISWIKAYLWKRQTTKNN